MRQKPLHEGNGFMGIFDNHIQLCAVAGGQKHGLGDIVVIAQAAQYASYPIISEIKTLADLNGGRFVIET